MEEDGALARKLAAVLPQLDERQRRVLLAAEARALGPGGVTRVARAAGVSRTTVHAALGGLATPAGAGRVRAPAGGRKALREADPELVTALEALVEPDARGDPMSPLRWTCKSTRQLAAALTAAGHPVSHSTVGGLLRSMDYSLQANVKSREGASHPDRDAQFRDLNGQVQAFGGRGLPVVSVDTKKKELVGQFRNGGRDWRPRGQPETVAVHDFADAATGKAIPYGIYDLARNAGWVSVGQDHDTAAFAVESLRRWWRMVGQAAYPTASELLICADGGSNGSRLRLWKWELGAWSSETALAITVCHFPPGTSKWNKIEHRLFSHISMNWRGRPLTSHEVVVELIGATTTTQGLQVHAERDIAPYPASVKVSDADMAKVPLHRHPFHGDWNYTILPTPIAASE